MWRATADSYSHEDAEASRYPRLHPDSYPDEYPNDDPYTHFYANALSTREYQPPHRIAGR